MVMVMAFLESIRFKGWLFTKFNADYKNAVRPSIGMYTSKILLLKNFLMLVSYIKNSLLLI